MNKDKIIKDLKERNDKLANQYRLRDIRCVHLELVNEKLEQENKQLKEEIEIKDRLINGIEERLKNHFRKLDRNGLEDNTMLLKIQELIKTARGDKE